MSNKEGFSKDILEKVSNLASLDLTEEELISYWKGISYDLTEEHKKGLELFRKYLAELALL